MEKDDIFYGEQFCKAVEIIVKKILKSAPRVTLVEGVIDTGIKTNKGNYKVFIKGKKRSAFPLDSKIIYESGETVIILSFPNEKKIILGPKNFQEKTLCRYTYNELMDDKNSYLALGGKESKIILRGNGTIHAKDNQWRLQEDSINISKNALKFDNKKVQIINYNGHRFLGID